jgi:hypothetical protein
MAAIELVNLYRDGVVAVDGVSLTGTDGEFVVLVGPPVRSETRGCDLGTARRRSR